MGLINQLINVFVVVILSFSPIQLNSLMLIISGK